MKKILLSIFLIYSISIFAQTSGTLTFTVNPTYHNSSYGTDHYVAIWIENSANAFVKTKLKRADSHGTSQHLPVWKASSNSNVVDATTGASYTNYNTPCTITWDATDVASSLVADGTYNIWVEFTWAHGGSTASTSYSFTKGPAVDYQTPANQTEFGSVVVNWIPDAAAPAADFAANSTNICPGETVDFQDMSSNTPTSWSWTFTGGTPATSTDQNPSGIVFTSSGLHTVELTATNANGSDTQTKTDYINVYTVAPVSISEAGGTITSDATSGNQWYESTSGIINGEISNTYTPTVTGDYYTIVTDGNGCTSTSNILNVVVSNINNIHAESIGIYPNPAKEVLNIPLNNINSFCDIVIENYMGANVYKERIGAFGTTVRKIDVNKFSSGVYILKVVTEKNIFEEKFIIE